MRSVGDKREDQVLAQFPSLVYTDILQPHGTEFWEFCYAAIKYIFVYHVNTCLSNVI